MIHRHSTALTPPAPLFFDQQSAAMGAFLRVGFDGGACRLCHGCAMFCAGAPPPDWLEKPSFNLGVAQAARGVKDTPPKRVCACVNNTPSIYLSFVPSREKRERKAQKRLSFSMKMVAQNMAQPRHGRHGQGAMW